MFKSAVYLGNSLLGDVEIYTQNPTLATWTKEIRISHFSPPSERCPPLAVLHTIASAGVSFRMESKVPPSDESPLLSLHAACCRENKTAVVSLGEEELHLVAMPSMKSIEKLSCFWGFNAPAGLYNSCLVMLNLRCLGIVFDLDETLIVANSMRSFEDRIEALQRKMNSEADPLRVSGMLAEVKRYQEDKTILKQYAENDQVVENGKVLKVQSEIVPPLSDNHQPIVRPVIRLQEKNIILTRVNPAIRDTSVLVRLRPAWEDLRSYLTARGRKRFEVYVCTMAERDYALEMWRLLDPEFNLINSKQLLDRIVCVKSGSRKSLLNVFQDGICHPKMALVIDDRLKVWDDKDQPRVHVVPAFAPYYAPQAEANNAVPVLCVARNVACNVRGGFFKDFDEGLLPRISDFLYEDEMPLFPSAPDVSNYLISEDDTSASNGNKDPLCFEGITDVEVERRLKDTNCKIQAASFVASNLDPRPMPSLQHVTASSSSMVPQASSQVITSLHNNQILQSIVSLKPLDTSGLSESSLQASPAREEGEVPESELDPDTRRRLLILQHGQDTRDHTPKDPPLPARPPLQVSVPPPVQTRGSWFPLEEEMSPRQLNKVSREFPLEQEAVHFDKKRSRQPNYFPGMENSIRSDRALHENKRLPKEVYHGDDRLRLNDAALSYPSFPGEEMPVAQISSSNRVGHFGSGQVPAQYSDIPAVVLQEIAMKLGTKVEFRTALTDTTELQFSIEVWFIGEKIGEGIGKTRKEAQHHAAESSLRNLANVRTTEEVINSTLHFVEGSHNKYLANPLPDPSAFHGDAKENGFVNDSNSFAYPTFPSYDALPIASTSESSLLPGQRLDVSKASFATIASLKELCVLEGFSLFFQAQPSISPDSINKGRVHAQVEIAGQVLGKGTGMTWEEAKLQAAEEALGNLKSMLGQFSHKRSCSPRSLSTTPSKRFKPELARVLQRIPSCTRYSKNDTPVS